MSLLVSRGNYNITGRETKNWENETQKKSLHNITNKLLSSFRFRRSLSFCLRPFTEADDNVIDINFTNFADLPSSPIVMAESGAFLKQVKDLNTSMAAVQQTLDEFRTEVIDAFKTARRLREDEERTIKARVASIGNQVAYLRDNVCHCLNKVVSGKID